MSVHILTYGKIYINYKLIYKNSNFVIFYNKKS